MMDAIETRKRAALILEHSIARLGYWGKDGWPSGDCDHDAVRILQNAKWGLEAMDSPATNRFWDEQRRQYHTMLESL